MADDAIDITKELDPDTADPEDYEYADEEYPEPEWDWATGDDTESETTTVVKSSQSSMDLTSMMSLMSMMTSNYQQMLMSLQEQYAEMGYEAAPTVKTRYPSNIALETAKVRSRLEKDTEREESLKLRLSDTTYTDQTLIGEPELIKESLLD